MHAEGREPRRIRLLEDYLDLKTGVAYPAGTILVRLPCSGQYGLEGTKLGEKCAGHWALVQQLSKVEVLEA